MSTRSKELDFEVNLLPILSVLSICICFLLTSAVWSRMGFIGINQAIGDELPASGKNSDTVFMKLMNNGEIIMQWKSGEDSSIRSEKTLQTHAKDRVSFLNMKKEVARFVEKAQTKTVIVMPEFGVNYGSIIKVLDQLKGLSLQIGLAPAIKELRR